MKYTVIELKRTTIKLREFEATSLRQAKASAARNRQSDTTTILIKHPNGKWT